MFAGLICHTSYLHNIQVLALSDKRLPCNAASQAGIGLLGDLGDVLGKAHLSLDEERECVLV